MRLLRDALVYGGASGILIALLALTEYRFLVIEHSVAIFGGVVALLFAGLGIGLGLTIKRKHVEVVVREVPVPADAPFVRDEARLRALGITPRELEILQLIAEGLSNREIGDRLCVSENTVKTHSGRLFDKLGARRRTEAVQLAKSARLIP